MSDPVTIATVSAEDFEGVLGQGFRVAYPDHAEVLTLEAVQRGGMTPPGSARGQSFSLLFQGESTTRMLAQFSHALAHDTLGTLDIFLVPVRRNLDGTHYYQAVFN